MHGPQYADTVDMGKRKLVGVSRGSVSGSVSGECLGGVYRGSFSGEQKLTKRDITYAEEQRSSSSRNSEEMRSLAKLMATCPLRHKLRANANFTARLLSLVFVPTPTAVTWPSFTGKSAHLGETRPILKILTQRFYVDLC